MNRKIIGLFITVVFVVLSVVILFTESISVTTIGCAAYNALTIICVLTWSGFIPVTDARRKAISVILWYGLIWLALFTSVKVLIISGQTNY